MTQTRQPNFALLLGIAWLLAAAQLVALSWAGTGESLIDTDDAMRLTQMRDWLAGQGWHDLNQPRVALSGYESHWSRLIDVGLAGTLWVFGLLADPPLAERLMRTAWPVLWLLPAMAGMAAAIWRLAGRNGALVALVLMVVGRPAFAQFFPGRIDHHNVQITLSVLLLAATVWSDRVRWVASAAGVLTGLALSIGLECLPYLVVCGAAFVVRYVIDREAARPAAEYGLALAVSSVVAFLAVVGPDHWMRGLCDAIALNWVAPVALAGFGLTLAGHTAWESRFSRALFALGIVAVATILFLAIEPRCLKGPYAMLDPAVWPVWLAHVTEMQSLPAMTRDSPSMGAGFAAFPFAALACTLLLAREPELRGDFGFLVVTAVFVIAVLMMVTAVRMSFYALWFAMPPVAAAALRLFDRLELRTVAARAFVAIMLAPAVLSATALSIVQGAIAARVPDGEQDTRRVEGCFNSVSYAPLAHLPAGVMAADIDFGPFLLALTPHSVLSAPYHRLSAAIIVTHQAFASPPSEARDILARLGTTYVATCGRQQLPGLAPSKRHSSLWGQLQAGAMPDWLEAIPLPGPFAVYRVKP